MKYDFQAIEKKWQEKWEEKKIFNVKEKKGKKKFYCLDMFPYPSGEGLHMGHAFVFSLGDIYARFKRLQGYNVLYPIGYDSFGLPAENAAIKVGEHPENYTKKSIANFMKQQKAMGWSYDWSRSFKTSDPEFYKWDQWIFLQMLSRGIAYRKKASVNWCDKCQSVLANEQVVQGKCWRHEETDVKVKPLEQWFLKTTKYAEELLDRLNELDWSERAKTMQKNWIGKSFGSEVLFEVENPDDKKISNVVIVHGGNSDNDKDYNKHWIPWIKKILESKGIKTETPQMPVHTGATYSDWEKIFGKLKVDEETILVGHSRGAAFLVRWLGETGRKVKKLILVAPWKIVNKSFKKSFYDFKINKSVSKQVKEIVLFTSDDEEEDGKKSAKIYHDSLGGKIIQLKNHGHFTKESMGTEEFPELLNKINSNEKWSVFTTRVDTLFGVTFMVVSAQHPRLMELVTDNQKKEVEKFLKKVKSVSEKDSADLEKEGVFTGSYAINPINNEKVPIHVGNFVLADYGSGMVMAVPAHDQRDFEFAKKYGLKIEEVVRPGLLGAVAGVDKAIEKELASLGVDSRFKDKAYYIKADSGLKKNIFSLIQKHMGSKFYSDVYVDGEIFVILKDKIFNLSGDLSKAQKEVDKLGVSKEFADLSEIKKEWEDFVSDEVWDFGKEKAFEDYGVLVNSGNFDGLESAEAKEHIVKYLEGKKLGKKTVNYKLRDWLISRQRYWGTPIPVVYCDKCGIVPVPEKDLPIKLPKDVKFGKGNPLLTNEEWINTKCPKCKGKARRETDTMDTFANSSWYLFRYCDSRNKTKIFDSKKVNYWCPVDQYIGGSEHITMHLIYVRFYTKFLRDIGMLNFDEPALRYFTQGFVKGIDGEKMSKSKGNVIEPLGTIKKYGADSLRFYLMSAGSPDSDFSWDENGIHGSFRFVEKVYDYFYYLKFGKADAKVESKLNKTIKEITNLVEDFKHNLAVIKLREFFDYVFERKIDKKTAQLFLQMFSIYCPYVCEEFWEKVGGKGFVSLSSWPKVDEKKINDKFEKEEEALEGLVGDLNNVKKFVKGCKKAFVYVIPGEKILYSESLKEIEKRINLRVEVFAVNDSKKHDPENKSKKAKPGKPGIYLE